MSDTKALVIEDLISAKEFVKERLFQASLEKIITVGDITSYIPKNKGCEYLEDLIMFACTKKSTDVYYRPLMEELWQDKALNKECTMRQGLKDAGSNISPTILFSVIYNAVLKEEGEFAL